MRAVILVGGLGTRLRPLTDAIPKPLVPIAGEPLMTRTLRRLRRQGVTRVTLAVQYLAAHFRAAYGDGAGLGLDLSIVEEPEPLGTAGAVRYALTAGGAPLAEPALVLNGDELTDLDVAALARHHRSAGALATIAIRAVTDTSAFGVVVCDWRGMVTAFQEKPAPGTALANTINSGAYVLEPAAIERIPAGTFAMLERDLFPRLLAGAAPVAAFAHDSYSQDIGTLAGYLAANEAVLLGRLPAEQPLGRQLAPGVWAGAGASVDPTARLVAPVMLGDGCVVGAGAALRRVIAWERVTIGERASLHDVALASMCHIQPAAVFEGLALGPERAANASQDHS
ncbi:MAG TPA: NDP-sugar synthase [Herpetosiphonaceae bacterium]|nr:NDP-sugar synthase [Herpetosiphonaceae bacterium]